MRALVTGGTGFLGRALLRRLLDAGWYARATARRPAPGLDPRVDWRVADMATADWSPPLEGVDVVFHLAWSSVPASVVDPAADAAENVVGSLRLIEAAAARPRPPRFVFASSGGTVYGDTAGRPAREDMPLDPIGAYAVAKESVERHLRRARRERGLDAVTLRLANPYGPGQWRPDRVFGVVATFLRAAIEGRPVPVFGDGRVVRDYFHVDDAVAAFLRVATGPLPSAVYNIGSGVGRDLDEVRAAVEAVVGRPLAVERHAARPVDLPWAVLDASRAATDLGWRAEIPFEAGLAATAGTFRRGPA
jgi:UDP-glucose 4-epimerase